MILSIHYSFSDVVCELDCQCYSTLVENQHMSMLQCENLHTAMLQYFIGKRAYVNFTGL